VPVLLSLFPPPLHPKSRTFSIPFYPFSEVIRGRGDLEKVPFLSPFSLFFWGIILFFSPQERIISRDEEHPPFSPLFLFPSPSSCLPPPPGGLRDFSRAAGLLLFAPYGERKGRPSPFLFPSFFLSHHFLFFSSFLATHHVSKGKVEIVCFFVSRDCFSSSHT